MKDLTKMQSKLGNVSTSRNSIDLSKMQSKLGNVSTAATEDITKVTSVLSKMSQTSSVRNYLPMKGSTTVKAARRFSVQNDLSRNLIYTFDSTNAFFNSTDIVFNT